MTPTPKVSILMAVHNAEAFLTEAIESVLRQTMTSWELLCVDDASTDKSLSILWSYAKRDLRVKVFPKTTNCGQAVARNEALQEARGEYITMLDADDWLSDDCLERALAVFDDQTDCVVLRLMQCYDDGREEVYDTPFTDYVQAGRDEHYDFPIISGKEAFEASLDWRLHGLYMVRAHLHKRYLYDTSCRLYSDDNTSHLHYLHSRHVRFCMGTYYYRKHAQSCTNAISPNRFLLMQANLSLSLTLRAEKVSEDVMKFYESYRWLNYIGQWWLYENHKEEFSPQEREMVLCRFRNIYETFQGKPVPSKFGYTRYANYRLFLLQEKAYFFLRKLLGRK